MNKKITAIIMLTASSVIFGFSFLFTKQDLNSLDIFQLLGIRFLVAAVIMGLLAAARIIKIRYNREKLKQLALITLMQPILYFVGETYGIKLTSASESGMMIALMPITIALFSMLILKEKLLPHQWGSVAASIAGMLLIIGAKGITPGSGSFLGYLFLLLAITAEGAYSPQSRRASALCSPAEITFAIMITGAIGFNAIGLAQAGINGTIGTYFTDALNLKAGVGILYLAILSSIAAFFMYNSALSKIKASASASFCNLTTVVSVLAGVALGGEKLLPMQIAGMILILISIWGILREKPFKFNTGLLKNREILLGDNKMNDGTEKINKYKSADLKLRPAIEWLAGECSRYDGHRAEVNPEPSMNYKNDMNCIFTYGDIDRLHGLLCVFAPGMYEIEISALVHPAFRKRGIFKALFTEALAEASRFGYRRGLIVTDAALETGLKIINRWELQKDHGEFRMTARLKGRRHEGFNSDIAITEASELDLEELTKLGTEVFDIDAGSERQLLLRTLNAPNRVQWAVRRGEKIVGLCGLRLENGECMVFGLGIHPDERRKGYGRELLGFIADYAEKQGADTLCLDVDSENEAALALYEGFGLKKTTETRYYTFKFRRMKKILKKSR